MNAIIEYTVAEAIDDGVLIESPGLLTPKQTKFSLGWVVITQNAADSLDLTDCNTALARHSSGDWGEVGKEDHKQNDFSLREGYRLLSAYTSTGGVKFWIITEADRSVTTVLLPEDY